MPSLDAIEEMKRQAQQLPSQIAGQAADIDTERGELLRLNNQIELNNRELSTLRAREHDLNNVKARLEAEIRDLTDRIREIENQITQRLGVDARDLENTLSSLESQISGVRSEISGLEQEINSLNREIGQLTAVGPPPQVSQILQDIPGTFPNLPPSPPETTLPNITPGHPMIVSTPTKPAENMQSMLSVLQSYQSSVQLQVESLRQQIAQLQSAMLNTRSYSDAQNIQSQITQLMMQMMTLQSGSRAAETRSSTLEQLLIAQALQPRPAVPPEIMAELAQLRAEINSRKSDESSLSKLMEFYFLTQLQSKDQYQTQALQMQIAQLQRELEAIRREREELERELKRREAEAVKAPPPARPPPPAPPIFGILARRPIVSALLGLRT
ncbi:MAG: hypothetical protein QW304_07875 [Thermoproteota archaeon]